MTNTLAPNAKPKTVAAPKGDHPMMAHAKIWQHVNGMDPAQVPDKISALTYGLPIIGSLAHKANVTRKDVIKAASDATGEGKLAASQAIDIISGMPDDPKDLRPWLRNLYAFNLTALVHLKAAQMSSQQSVAPAQPGPAPTAAPPQAAPAMPAPGAPQ